MTKELEQSDISEKHFCAHCGTENAMSDYACIRCGERLVQVTSKTESPLGLLSCAECENTNNLHAAYCWFCGTEISGSAEIEAVNPKSVSESEGQVTSVESHKMYRPELNPVSTTGNQRNASESKDIETNDTDQIISEWSDTENTSGQREGSVPTEIKGWNWAAFLMPAVWGLFSGVPIAAALWAAVFLPAPFGQIVLLIGAVFLGFKGNEFAWRGKRWESIDHFTKTQKKWGTWAVRISLAFLILALIYARSVA